MRAGSWHSHYPIARAFGLKPQAHGVPAEETHGDTHRGEQSVIDDPQKNPCVDPAKRMADPHPYAMGLLQAPRRNNGKDDQSQADAQGPYSRRFLAKDHRPQTDDRKDSSDQQTERPKLFCLLLFVNHPSAPSNRVRSLFASPCRSLTASVRP